MQSRYLFRFIRRHPHLNLGGEDIVHTSLKELDKVNWLVPVMIGAPDKKKEEKIKNK
jgi:hypothetical protein